MDRRKVIKALMGGLAFPVVPIQIETASKKIKPSTYFKRPKVNPYLSFFPTQKV